MRGLRVRPQYKDLIGVAKSGGLGNIVNPLAEMRNLFEEVLFHHSLMAKAWGKCNYSKKRQVTNHSNNNY